MSKLDLSLYAHLMRRAGFGATRAELEEYASRGYECVVDDLLHPEKFHDIEEDLLQRYYKVSWRPAWLYRMVNTGRPLSEKMTLFWHQFLAVGRAKSGNHATSSHQIETFRRDGLTNLRKILNGVSGDPAMIFWLDNQENFRDQPNENYGRELLELFSMGVGNHTEKDVKAATQSFTGWSFTPVVPGTTPYGTYGSEFNYLHDEHDYGGKNFMGEAGRFNGSDIIDIIVRQPATARFFARKLYDFFVADEPPVASWNEIPPQDPEAIDTLAKAFLHSHGEIRPVLELVFNSEFFKTSKFRKVKSPTELVTGLIKLQGTYRFPAAGMERYERATSVMGQELLNPTTVEGWHTGPEWINGGTLNERVNFAVSEMSDPSVPSVREILDRLRTKGPTLSPEQFVDTCLDFAGPLEVSGNTRDGLLRHAELGGLFQCGNGADPDVIVERIMKMLQLVVSTREYQFE